MMEVKITKYGDRKFWLAYVVIDGKRGQTRSTKATNKREVERFAAVWEAAAARGLVQAGLEHHVGGVL